MRHIKLVVQYDGTNYAGFQVQPDAITIQGVLQQALYGILKTPCGLVAASRTDAGVHAVGQVVRVDMESPIPVEGLVRALNEALPRDIAVSAGEQVSAGFHPRYDAVSKAYQYRIRNCASRSPFEDLFAWHMPAALDLDAMSEAALALRGQHDFSAFAVAGGSSRSTVRRLFRAECAGEGEDLRVVFCGDGFLYMMVRSIVGTLVEVGMGKRTPGSMSDVLASQDRSRAGRTAPPQGLMLMHVCYPGCVGGVWCAGMRRLDDVAPAMSEPGTGLNDSEVRDGQSEDQVREA